MAELSIQQLFDRALRHHKAGQLADAEPLYTRILAAQPANADALRLLGVLRHQVGRNDAAVDLIGRAIAIDPKFAEAHSNLGGALSALGRKDEAAASFRKAIELNPRFAGAHCNLANVLKDQGFLEGAIAEYRQAIALEPRYAEAHSNLGNALALEGKLEEAIEAHRKAVELAPNLPGVYLNLGNVLRDTRRNDEAIAVYRKAVALNDNSVEAHVNLGTVLAEKGELAEAVTTFRHAIKLNPKDVEAHSHLGTILKEEGRIDEAIVEFRLAVAAGPQNADAYSNLLLAMHFDPTFDAAALLREHLVWAQRFAGQARKSSHIHRDEKDAERRIRVGYVSPDFRNHVVGRHLLPLLVNHDRVGFEIYCYSDVRIEDSFTQQLRAHADHWQRTVGLPDGRLADLISGDGIDILVDLTLHTAGSRLGVFALKPAPVQVTWLGYPGTTGLAAVDYRLSDPFMDPPGTDGDYVEKTVRLPHTFWCYQTAGDTPDVGRLPAHSAGHVTFGCLNNFAKVSGPALELWARIMRGVPASRLVIQSAKGSHRDRMTARMAQLGIGQGRIEFFTRSTWHQYMSQYGRIDIAFDPFPFGGGITTCDALWMGVPVATLSGGTAVGRGGRSILSNVGLPELIAETPDQYAAIASALATDLDRLEKLREGLRGRMLASPLMDAKGFAGGIESAYRWMWGEWCKSPRNSGV